ncbi:decorin [Venturia canescens]|uniref:decorin n=1 Tax=Venturia canescens TaxID=32260 RepID=UPI001C9C33B8|nr:decorin [Venturia canescens]XP_043283692.1 decorin [Venturia canescens]
MFIFFVNLLLLAVNFGTAIRREEVMILGAEPRATLLTDRDASPRKCRYAHPYSMLQARCTNLGLDEVPKNLRTDIQILDFSVNRLRDLQNETFSSYTSLAFLYLQDNFIQTIEEGSFDRLRSLEVIDLTKNGCQDFPKSTLALPYLRKLFLSQNKLNDASFAPTSLSEESNLEYLELSKNQLRRLPSFGNLPSLKYLNVSKNLITSVSTEDLARFCSLEVLDLTGNPIKFNETSCDCENFNWWIDIRRIKMKPEKIDCGSNAKKSRQCTASSEPEISKFSNETNRLYDSCRNVIETRAATAKARSTWILVASCLGVSLLLLFITLYCIHKKNNRKKARQRLKHQQQLALNNANTELLNGNVSPEQT